MVKVVARNVNRLPVFSMRLLVSSRTRYSRNRPSVPVSIAEFVHQWSLASVLDDEALNEDASFGTTKAQMRN